MSDPLGRQGSLFHEFNLEDKVPDDSTFSVNRLGRFHESDILRKVFDGAYARREALCAAA